MNPDDRHACACCSYLTLSEPGGFEICPVCYWEDDDVQRRNPALAGGANKECLVEARKTFAAIGASSAELRDAVRKPTAEEMPR